MIITYQLVSERHARCYEPSCALPAQGEQNMRQMTRLLTALVLSCTACMAGGRANRLADPFQKNPP